MTLRIPESLFSGHTLKIADVRNQPVLADTNILADSLPPTYKPASFFMIYCCFEDQGALAVRRTFTDLNVTKSEFMNEGFPFAANCAYIFAVEVSEDEEINFRYTNNSVATKLTVIESQIM